ncbi:hypothetical protein AXF42_Ash012208 [Apostasia shenzhenica]|uniref:Microtubule-binding protein TANGLED n=1 Tax=Apostasia shenzhenica TaxID=1088818 RepID=A0A2I0B4C4_9ASPA|nr:hypothetical protein AXF42_Ash012208 [Apostasia shenzhenica]
MVAKAPPKEKKMKKIAFVNPDLLRETVQKVSRVPPLPPPLVTRLCLSDHRLLPTKVENCMDRLLEIQYTVAGGTKVIAGVNLSPRSTRGYLRTSLICKQESMRYLPLFFFFFLLFFDATREWRKMSLPAMLLGETIAEILQASQFVTADAIAGDPKTPDNCRREGRRIPRENSEIRARRAKEKQSFRRKQLSDSGSPMLARARSRINFRANSDEMRISDRRPSAAVNRIWQKNRPLTMKKPVLFPNPLFLSTSPSSSNQQRFYKTRSPIILRNSRRTPHKFLIKTPSTSLGSQLKSKKAVPAGSISPVERKTKSSLDGRRRSFSPARLAKRLVSPLKNRLSLTKGGGDLVSGLRQRPNFAAAARRFSSTLIMG